MQDLRDELTALRQGKVEMEAEIQRLAAQIATGAAPNPVSVIHSQVHMQALLHDLPMWQAENQSQPQSQPQAQAQAQAQSGPQAAPQPLPQSLPALAPPSTEAAPPVSLAAVAPMSE